MQATQVTRLRERLAAAEERLKAQDEAYKRRETELAAVRRAVGVDGFFGMSCVSAGLGTTIVEGIL